MAFLSLPCNINKTYILFVSPGELWTNVRFMVLKYIHKYFILSFYTVSVNLCECSPATPLFHVSMVLNTIKP